MMFDKKCHLRLEANGRCLHEISSNEIKSEITIGRDSTCDWRLPASDRGVSGRHARIHRKGNAVYIQDMKSRNGIYFMGEKISERKLAVGDIYSLGDGKLVVEEVQHAATVKSHLAHHRFEQLTGKNRGKVYQLAGSVLKIGASSACDIVLDDSLVSHVHAVIENHKDDTCWIKDMGSRNGTKVNGTTLSAENAETGRMLKDGDIVSIAYIDFRFWDKSVTHIRSHIFLKLGVVAATFAIAVGGYFAVQTVSPSAKSIRLKAERCAAAECFDEAGEILKGAATARGAESDAAQRLDLMRKLGVWKKTAATWKEIKRKLSGNADDIDFYKVNELFSGIIVSDRERWQWNADNAMKEMKNAQETHELLVAVLGAEEHLRHDEENFERLEGLQKLLAGNILVCAKDDFAYRRALLESAGDLADEIKRLSAEHSNVSRIMSAYASVDGTDETIALLESVKKQVEERCKERKKKNLVSSGIVGNYCRKLLVPLAALRNSRNLLEKNYGAIARMSFDEFVADLALPSTEACIVSANLAIRRAEMERANRNLEKIIVQLKNAKRMFGEYGIAPGRNSELLERVFSDDVWASVLSCDCLGFQMPTYSEKTSRSRYDRMLGVHVFWDYLRSLGGEFDTTVFDDRFKPELFKAKEIFGSLETFKTFCSPKSRAPYVKEIQRLLKDVSGENVFRAYCDVADALLTKRDERVEALYKRFKSSPGDRGGIIAGAAALYLSPDTKFCKTDELVKSLDDSLRKLRKKSALLVNVAGEITPEQMIENRKTVLAIGIPGDPLLKEAWTTTKPMNTKNGE